MSKNRVDILIAAKDQASRQMGIVAKSALSMSKTIRVAAAGAMAYIGGRAMLGFIRESIRLYGEQELAEKRLEQALRSTGHAAGYTKDQLIAQAEALQDVTTYGDDAIVGVQALLATFTKVKGTVFEEGTELALDMSEALGQDLKSSVIQLGKALNDPVIGATALRRVGVSLSDQQMDQIKLLVKQNHLYKAQRLILEELRTEFGGQARAAALTDSGAIRDMKDDISELREEFARGLMPAIAESAREISAWARTHKQQIYEATVKTISYMELGKDAFVAYIQYLRTDFVDGGEFAMHAFVAVVKAGMINAGLATEAGLDLLAWKWRKKFSLPSQMGMDWFMPPESWRNLEENFQKTWQAMMQNIAADTPKPMGEALEAAWIRLQFRLAELEGGPGEIVGSGGMIPGGGGPGGGGPGGAAGTGGRGRRSNVFESLLMVGAPGRSLEIQREIAQNTKKTESELKRLTKILQGRTRILQMQTAAVTSMD